MKSLSDLLIMQAERINFAGGIYGIKEADREFNKINRAIIRAMRRERGRCFLIDPMADNPIKEYHGGMVKNFQCKYITPKITKNIYIGIKQIKGTHTTGFFQHEHLGTAIYDAGGLVLVWV